MKETMNKKVMTHKLLVVCKIFQALLATTFKSNQQHKCKNAKKHNTSWELVNITHTIRVKNEKFCMKVGFNLKESHTNYLTKKYEINLTKKLDEATKQITDITKLTVEVANVFYLIEFAEKMYYAVYDDISKIDSEAFVESRIKALS